VREQAHRSFPKELENHDIARIVRDFGQAARRCKEGGLDGLELIAHGHLIDQFWSPRINDRVDAYGRGHDLGLRFFYKVLDKVRAQVGDEFIVGIRMAGYERVEPGLGPAEMIDIAKRIVKTGGIDFVNIVDGFMDTDGAISHVIPPSGTPLGSHLPVAVAVKAELDIPVFNGARIIDLETDPHAIESGLVDMVGMVRAHIADPHIVSKLERGEADRIRTCVGASYCLNRIYLGFGGVYTKPRDWSRGNDPSADRVERWTPQTGRSRGRRRRRNGGGPCLRRTRPRGDRS
jgi:2,4-dienoyl-CoA reductase-like NADH-dependent reductase (Old Yellow Enzyme family)